MRLSDRLRASRILELIQQFHRLGRAGDPGCRGSKAGLGIMSKNPLGQNDHTLKSLAPADKNWSPTCRVLDGAMSPKYRWHARTPQDLSPISTKTSFPPERSESIVRNLSTRTVESTKWHPRPHGSPLHHVLYDQYRFLQLLAVHLGSVGRVHAHSTILA